MFRGLLWSIFIMAEGGLRIIVLSRIEVFISTLACNPHAYYSLNKLTNSVGNLLER
jgi:hypothetical protein